MLSFSESIQPHLKVFVVSQQVKFTALGFLKHGGGSIMFSVTHGHLGADMISVLFSF